jgi:hypothetical protein
MIKLNKILGLLLLISTTGFSQKNAPEVDKTLFFMKGGVGTSWIIMPKVYILNETDGSSAQILPATNSFTGYIGFQTAIPIGEHWLFMPEIDINYLSGEIRVDRPKANAASQKLQSYTRLEIPLNFAVVSSDNFWVSFGPVIYFTLSDNKGFDAAVEEVVNTDPPPSFEFYLNSDNPVGLRFRLATYIVLAKGMYIDIKFDSDLKSEFHYTESDKTYNMKMSFQSITVGFGYRLNRAGL